MKEKRKKFVKNYIEEQKKQGIKVAESVTFLSKVLFISERTVLADYYE